MRLSLIAFRNLWRNTRRTVLSIGAITISSILGVFFLAMVDGMEASAREAMLRYYTGTIQVRHEEYGEYEYLSPMHLFIPDVEPLAREIRQIPGVTLVTPRVSAPGQITIDRDPTDLEPGERYRAIAFAVDLEAERDLLELDGLVHEGTLPQPGSREVGLGRELASTTGLSVGDEFAFVTETAERSANATSFRVTAVLDFPQPDLNKNQFLASFNTMQPFLRMGGGAQQLIVMTDDPDSSQEQLAAVRRIVARDPDYDAVAVTHWKEEGFLYSILVATGAIYDIMVIFFLVLGATVIVNTTMMTVFERYREIGVLGAMGMKPPEIVRLFFLESVFAGLISAVVGVAVGSGVSLILGEVGLVLPATYGELGFEMSNVIYPELTAGTVVLMLVYTVTIPALVTLLPSSKAARVEPVDAINAT